MLNKDYKALVLRNIKSLYLVIDLVILKYVLNGTSQRQICVSEYICSDSFMVD